MNATSDGPNQINQNKLTKPINPKLPSQTYQMKPTDLNQTYGPKSNQSFQSNKFKVQKLNSLANLVNPNNVFD